MSKPKFINKIYSNQVISGIYKIENLINHKVYIGQSKNIYKRWKSHINSYEKIKKYLYSSMRKYGIENFSFEILIETYDLNYWEMFLIQIYKSNDKNYGYNRNKGGDDVFSVKYVDEKEQNEIKEKFKKTMGLMSDEEKQKKIDKMKNTIANRTEEEKQMYHDILVIAHSKTPKEVKESAVLKRKNTIDNWTKEEKDMHLKNYSISKSNFNLFCLNDKSINSQIYWTKLNYHIKYNKYFLFENEKIHRAKDLFFINLDEFKQTHDLNYFCDKLNDIKDEYKIWYSYIMARTFIQCVETNEIHSDSSWRKVGFDDALRVAKGEKSHVKHFHFIIIEKPEYEIYKLSQLSSKSA